MTESEESLLELADVMTRLGQEFKQAAEVDEPTIDWYGATVELESVVERDANGGVRFYVVSAGGSTTARNTIKVTVNIAPHGREPMPGGM